jgi:hypothetical protein
MTIVKFQKYLKNKYKFTKFNLQDTVESLEDHFIAIMTAVKKENSMQLKQVLKPFVIDLLKLMNSNDIEIDDLLKGEYNE